MRKNSILLLATFLTASALAPARAEQNLLLPSSSNVIPAASPASQPALSSTRLVAFQEQSDRFNLQGESDLSEFSFRATAEMAKVGGKLVLAYKNAVSVLPDDAVMHVEINGKSLADLAVASPFDFTAQTLAVAPENLKAGLNTVRVSIRQHHRVDCSLDATYELWTKIDPATSGFLPTRFDGYARFEDLFSIGRRQDGMTDLRLVVSPGAGTDVLSSAARIAQTLGLYLNRRDMLVTVADRPGTGPGIDLFVGTDNKSRSEEAVSPIFAEAPFGATIRTSNDAERAAVIFRASSADEIDRQLVDLVRGPMSRVLDENVSRRGLGEIDGKAASEFTLEDIGIRSTSFGGRLMRTKFDLVMPADFYPAEYATVDLRLNAVTAAGLDPSAQMLVRVNDKVVNAFPFRNTDGQTFNDKLIRLPLRGFQPGVNRVELLAELPRAIDTACAPAERDDARPRYVLLDNTKFVIPELARVARLPDLAAFAGNAYPFRTASSVVYLKNHDRQTVGAAMTLLSRLAQSARHPLNARLEYGQPPARSNGDMLVIGSEENDLSTTEPSAVSLKAAELDPTETSAVADGTGMNDDQLIRAFEQSSAGNDSQLSITARVTGLMGEARKRFENWLSYRDSRQATLTSAQTLLSISQAADSGSGRSITEIRAGSPEDLARGIARILEPSAWNSLSGGSVQVAALDGKIVPLAARHLAFADVTDNSVGNWRRVAAAWLSDNFQIYVVAVIVLIGIFAAWLGRLVQFKGVRTAK